MPATSNPLQVTVRWTPRRSWRAAALLQRVAACAARAEGFRSGQLSIAVVGARAMATLHRRFLGSLETTDVLAFDLGSDRRQGNLDAEVVLCADVARRMARRRGGTLSAARAELALYLVHGILHLAGYDDHTPRGFRRMHAREDELLTQLGLPPAGVCGKPAE
jgi:probable rRNA maturation factor